MATYTYDDISKAVNNRLHNKIGKVTDSLASINTAVKQLWGQVNLRTAKRKSTLSPVLSSTLYSYTLPTDVKGFGIIDLVPQLTTTAKPDWSFVPREEFDRNKTAGKNIISIDPNATTYKLLISTLTDNTALGVWDLIYYTKYPWQSSTGVYKQDATTSTDYLNVDADEYNLVVEQCVEYLGKIVREYEDAKDASNTLNNLLLPSYQSRYPSEALTYASTYYSFGSIDGDWWTG